MYSVKFLSKLFSNQKNVKNQENSKKNFFVTLVGFFLFCQYICGFLKNLVWDFWPNKTEYANTLQPAETVIK